MSLNEKIKILSKLSIFDVSDALSRLQREEGPPFGGHIPGLSLEWDSPSDKAKVIGQAMTVKYASVKSADKLPPSYTSVPPGAQYVDLVKPGSVVVIDQEPGLSTALVGPNMVARMKLRGAKAIIVAGNVRDLQKIKYSRLPIWAEGTSLVPFSVEAMVMDINVPISPHGVTIEPGDIMICEPEVGVVRIPLHLVDDVISLVPKIDKANKSIHTEILRGGRFKDAVEKHSLSKEDTPHILDWI